LEQAAFDAAWFWRLPPATVLDLPLDELATYCRHGRRINEERTAGLSNG
jgi:hypothetical protein